MFPKTGIKLPAGRSGGAPDTSYASAIAMALRSELGGTHQAIKTVMRWTGASERSAKNWIAGTSGPSGEHLIDLMRNSTAVLEVVLSLSGREATILPNALKALRDKLVEAVELIDTFSQIDAVVHVPCASIKLGSGALVGKMGADALRSEPY